MKDAFVPLSLENYQDAYQIHTTGHFKPWSQSVFADCITRPYFAYQLQDNMQTIGYYLSLQVLDEATLMDITVDRTRQGQGWGGEVLKHFMHQCQLRDVSTIWLEVRQSNHAAIHLYEKAGFSLVEKRVNYYPTANGREDALMMHCVIAQEG
ncbi:MAG: ribosomal-protein-alanine N-acetyltransferase [Paraglaciecola sp.]|jgi:ribosomal-protein-alanine N-acetyltransferase